MNDIYIQRTDAEGTVTQHLKVPLTYSPKDKMMARVEQNAKLDRETAITLPRMAFELVSMDMDESRKKNTLNQIVRKHPSQPNKMKMQYQSVPWNLSFNLYIFVKNAEDGTKILEQILPYFKPQWDMTLNILPEMGINLDTPVFIGNPTCEDKYDGAFTERRAIIWTVPFTLKGEYFGPVKEKPIIKFSVQEYYLGEPQDGNEMVATLNVQPGLTANGEPTSSANNSVDPNTIYATDDFGFVIESSGQILVEGDE